MAGAAEVIEFQTATLPILLERASRALLDAKTSAELLEVRELGRGLYDAAKAAGRYAQAKRAHDDVIDAVRETQGKAQEIVTRAEMRLADEYDAAQKRGEVGQSGSRTDLVAKGNEVPPTAAEVGLDRKNIHQARKLRDAENASPGKTKAVIDGIVARGEEPTRAKIQREVVEKPAKPAKEPVDAERRKLEKLSEEALIDEVLGLRADLKDERAKRAELKRECDDLKERLKEALGSDQGKTIGNLQNQLRAAKLARDDAMTETKRFEYKLDKANKRIAELEKMGISV